MDKSSTSIPREKPIRLVKIGEVIQRTGLGRTSIHNYVNSGRFPKPVKISGASSRWVEHEVDMFIGELMAKRGRE